MKKIAFIVWGLSLLMMGCTKEDMYENEADAVLKSAETKTYQAKFTDDSYFTPLFCEGEIVDYVSGYISAHWRVHYKNGVRQWILINFSGTLTSANGEVLTIRESDKILFEEGMDPTYSVRWNIMGEDGSHYIGSGYVDWTTWDVVPEMTVCPPENQK
ncbi:hypothetical protein [Maribellus luteus]|nr:hypothetical protein [Maribellus luteus]